MRVMLWYVTGEESSVSGVSVSEDDGDKAGTEAEDEPVTVEVPQIDDDELSSFFITACQHQDQREREEANIDTFNDMFIDSNDMYALTVLSAVCRIWVRHSEGPPLRRSCPPLRSEAIGGRKSIGRIPRVRVRVRLDQPAIQVSSRSFGMADPPLDQDISPSCAPDIPWLPLHKCKEAHC